MPIIITHIDKHMQMNENRANSQIITGVTPMNNDLKIANSTVAEPIAKIAEKLGIPEEALVPYGKDIAKIQLSYLTQPDPHYRNQPNAGRRRKNNRFHRSCRRPFPQGAENLPCLAGAIPRPGFRYQGRRYRGRLRTGDPYGGY